MKRSAIKAMRRTSPEKTKWLAMLGASVAVPHGKEMVRLVANCENVRWAEQISETLVQKSPKAQHSKLRAVVQTMNRRRVRRTKRWLAPHFVALLFDALANLDPQPLKNLAAIVRRIREYNANPQAAFPDDDKAMRLANVARLKGEPPMTQKELLQRMGKPPKDHDNASRERKMFKRLPIAFAPDKRGRKKGTRKRGT